MPSTTAAAQGSVGLDRERFGFQDAEPSTLAMRTVALTRPVPFGRSAAEDLLWLRLLREATSYAVRLRWTLDGLPHFPLDALIHLVPPTGGTASDSEQLARSWSAGYRYGLYYYRQGPGFVSVKDVRPGQEMRRLVISEGSDHFLAMTGATRLDQLDAEAQAAVADAVDAGLALVAEEHLLVLPYRMRNWPVPTLPSEGKPPGEAVSGPAPHPTARGWKRLPWSR
ncbi:hypothetical protein GXW82_02145 [Streptacidiphilus sp. 4-A2]|nr:hypothetical protein [Streptacidiphilus sp. 4-A2]